MGTPRYVLRTDKLLKNGKAPIDFMYQVEGQRAYYRTDKKVYTANWDVPLQNAIYIDKKEAKKLMPGVDFNLLPTAKEIDDLNMDLTYLKVDALNIENDFERNRVEYSSQMIITKLKEKYKKKTKKEKSSNEVFEFMEKYLKDHEATREAGSLSVYKSVKNHLQNYCKASGKKVTFDNIDYNFFQSFQAYLLKDKKNEKGERVPGLNNTTVAKQLSTIKTFLNYARTQGIAVSDKFRDFKIKKESLEVIALTNEEFESLYKMDLKDNKKLSQTRDVFCFACVTGLRYSDLKQLRREHLKHEEIKLTVTKTKRPLTIPLVPISKDILSRYDDQHKPLPVISNKNLNLYIKELCKKAGIIEPIEIIRFNGAKRIATTYPKYDLIGVHNGRKTFASLSLEKGMSAEEVMSIGGWTDYKSFKRYVKVTEKRNKVVMSNAWGTIPIMKAV
jgi:integrase